MHHALNVGIWAVVITLQQNRLIEREHQMVCIDEMKLNHRIVVERRRSPGDKYPSEETGIVTSGSSWFLLWRGWCCMPGLCRWRSLGANCRQHDYQHQRYCARLKPRKPIRPQPGCLLTSCWRQFLMVRRLSSTETRYAFRRKEPRSMVTKSILKSAAGAHSGRDIPHLLHSGHWSKFQNSLRSAR